MPRKKTIEIPELDDSEEYLSGEVQEILGQPPHWLSTWGTAAIVCCIALLTLVSFVFSYPDIIQGEFTLKTAEPPVPVVSSSSGYLAEIKVKEADKVLKNDILVVFESDASTNDVLKLEKEVTELSEFNLETLKLFRADWSLKLGELEPTYTSFVNVLEYLPFSHSFVTDEVAISGTSTSIRQIENDINRQQKLLNIKSSELTDAYANRDFFFKSYTNSGNQHEGSRLMEANLSIKKLETEVANLDGIIAGLKKELMDQKAKMLELRVDRESGTKEKIFQIKQALTELESEIAKWKEQYLVMSPAEGKVSFFNELREKEFKRAGEELMVIVPESAGSKFFGQVKLAATGSGKVEKGQSVTIKFDRYPFREFGVVFGEVSRVYEVPFGNDYYVDISMKRGLVTDKNKQLDFQHNLSGKAEIITENRTFFSRLFEKIKL